MEGKPPDPQPRGEAEIRVRASSVSRSRLRKERGKKGKNAPSPVRPRRWHEHLPDSERVRFICEKACTPPRFTPFPDPTSKFLGFVPLPFFLVVVVCRTCDCYGFFRFSYVSHYIVLSSKDHIGFSGPLPLTQASLRSLSCLSFPLSLSLSPYFFRFSFSAFTMICEVRTFSRALGRKQFALGSESTAQTRELGLGVRAVLTLGAISRLCFVLFCFVS